MLILSDRLKKIADLILDGEIVADIGTDHAKLPIYLRMKKKSSYVILSDLRSGPLEKAKQNIERYAPGLLFDLRLGSGLETIEPGEVDTVVIAGMGGLLTCKILGADLDRANSFGKYILQPRNATDKLREWLVDNSFVITDEALVKEGKFICEIIVASPLCKVDSIIHPEESYGKLSFEISPILFKKADPLLTEFIERKIHIEHKALAEIDRAEETKTLTGTALQRRQAILNRLIELQDLLLMAEKTGD